MTPDGPLRFRVADASLATGMAGKPNRPRFPDRTRSPASSSTRASTRGLDAYAGRRVVVVGSNNAALDICGALCEVGADVTMVQRSSTHIVRRRCSWIAFKALYSEEAVESGVSTEKADLIVASLPYRIMHQFQIPVYERIRERDAVFYERLERAGFEHDWGEDGSGMAMKYLPRGSGYYIDVGAADLITDGRVKLARGQVEHLTEDAVVLADETELEGRDVLDGIDVRAARGRQLRELRRRTQMVFQDPIPWTPE